MRKRGDNRIEKTTLSPYTPHPSLPPQHMPQPGDMDSHVFLSSSQHFHLFQKTFQVGSKISQSPNLLLSFTFIFWTVSLRQNFNRLLRGARASRETYSVTRASLIYPLRWATPGNKIKGTVPSRSTNPYLFHSKCKERNKIVPQAPAWGGRCCPSESLSPRS